MIVFERVKYGKNGTTKSLTENTDYEERVSVEAKWFYPTKA